MLRRWNINWPLILLLGTSIGLLISMAPTTSGDVHSDNNIFIPGANSVLELSAKGAASDIRSWAPAKVGVEGARLFINNIAEPGEVDTIINRNRGNVGIGTASPAAKLTVEGDGGFFFVTDPSELGAAVEAGTPNDGGWAGAFIGLSSNANGVYILGGNTGAYISVPLGQTGLLVAQGTKSAVFASSRGARALYAEEASEVWFIDYGFGQLRNGRALIPIDRLFAEAVNLDQPYHVFVQTYGNAELYVSQRTSRSFEVHLRDGVPNVEFSYRIVAKRRGYEETRLEHVPMADNDPNLYPGKRPKLPFRSLQH